MTRASRPRTTISTNQKTNISTDNPADLLANDPAPHPIPRSATAASRGTLRILVIASAVLASFASLAGLFWPAGAESWPSAFQSVRGEWIQLQGTGLYRYDSAAVAAQGQASDLVTLVLAVPLLLASLFLCERNSFRGRLLMAGTLGYFLYTYVSYAFLWMYNPLFLVYTALMSMSLFAFILAIRDLDMDTMPARFDNRLPVRLLGGFQLFIAFALTAMWLGKILPTLDGGSVPVGLEHYTTLVIQAMDLGIIVPTAVLSGVSLMRRRPIGYLLTSVILMKGITMLTSITAMVVNSALRGLPVTAAEAIVFPLMNLAVIPLLAILLRHARPNRT